MPSQTLPDINNYLANAYAHFPARSFAPGLSGPGSPLERFGITAPAGIKTWGTLEEVAAGLAKYPHKPGGPGKHRGLLGRITHSAGEAFNKDTARAAAKTWGTVGLLALGGNAALGGFGGAGAGVGAGGFVPGTGGGGALGGLGGVGISPFGGIGLGARALGSAGGGGGGVPWYNTFGGQTAINTGLNLFGGYLQNRAVSKAEKANRKQTEERIRQALAALSPEHIMMLVQQFLPQAGANAFAAGSTAIQAVREQAARTGQLENPRALSFEAGTRSGIARGVQHEAFMNAMNLAGGQASAITGAPYTPIAPKTGISDAIINSVNQAYYAKARSQAPSQYLYPGQIPYAGGGTPSPFAVQQFEGTPYRWPFYGAR